MKGIGGSVGDLGGACDDVFRICSGTFSLAHVILRKYLFTPMQPSTSSCHDQASKHVYVLLSRGNTSLNVQQTKKSRNL